MSNKPLDIGEEARVQMPMKTVASLIVLVAMGGLVNILTGRGISELRKKLYLSEINIFVSA